SNLADLDADIKEKQGGRDVILRQAHFTERAGKPEAVEQAKRKGYDPRRARGDSSPSFALANNIESHKHDRQRDRRFDRLGGNVHEPERSKRKGNAVCD